jgi:hypothetical protein
MPWKIKRLSECYPGEEAKAKSQERYVRLLLIAVIIILSLFCWIYVSQVRANGSHQIDLAGIRKTDESA